MEQLEVVFGLFVVLAVIATLARRIEVPYPILLVMGGLVIGLVPGLPRVEVDPNLILLVFLPPLLYAAALAMPPRELRDSLRPISLLAFGLVLFTMTAVAVAAHATIDGLSWAAGFTLGAIVSPPDPVAAVAIANRLGLPRRLVTILEGEGLFNDVTALVVYRLAVAAVVTGSFSLIEVGVRFVLAAVGALAIDRVGASGILATLTAGLYLARYGPGVVTSAGRLQGQGLWDILVFILEGISFILIGLELRPVLDELGGRPVSTLLGEAALVCAVVIVVRIVWVFAAGALSRALRTRPGQAGWRNHAVVAWAGMRGVVSLAAALAIPLRTDTGAPFPQRDLLIFLSFSVILVTLVGQGLTLPPLIRRLDVVEPVERAAREEAATRLRLARAALERLDDLERELDLPDEQVEGLRQRYQRIVERCSARLSEGEEDHEERHRQTMRDVQRELIAAERAELLRIRVEHGLSQQVYRRLSHDLDIEELRLGR